jgi:hypothetical protein
LKKYISLIILLSLLSGCKTLVKDVTSPQNRHNFTIRIRIWPMKPKLNGPTLYHISAGVYNNASSSPQKVLTDSIISLDDRSIIYNEENNQFQGFGFTFKEGDLIKVKISNPLFGEIIEKISVPPSVINYLVEPSQNTFDLNDISNSITIKWEKVNCDNYSPCIECFDNENVFVNGKRDISNGTEYTFKDILKDSQGNYYPYYRIYLFSNNVKKIKDFNEDSIITISGTYFKSIKKY